MNENKYTEKQHTKTCILLQQFDLLNYTIKDFLNDSLSKKVIITEWEKQRLIWSVINTGMDRETPV